MSSLARLARGHERGAISQEGLWKGPGGWWLAPEGAAIRRREQVAVVADIHLGYEWARASGGDMLPAHSLNETVETLTALLARVPVRTLIVAGDLVESSLPCRRTAADVDALEMWLEQRGVAWVVLPGNHDPPRDPAGPATLQLAGWTIAHGHRPVQSPRRVVGHHHPVLRVIGITAPCFLIGRNTIVLPAFSRNAAGLDVRGRAISPGLGREALRCLASTGEELLDFGPCGADGRIRPDFRPGERLATDLRRCPSASK